LVKYFDVTKTGQLIWPIFQGLIGAELSDVAVPPDILAKYQATLEVDES